MLLDDLSRPTKRVLEHPECRPPSERVSISKMSGQRLDRRRHELVERGSTSFSLRRLARPATQVATCTAGFTEFGRAQTCRARLLRIDMIRVAPMPAKRRFSHPRSRRAGRPRYAAEQEACVDARFRGDSVGQ